MSKNKNNIMVSVLCTSYNHEPYIRDCLDSIIEQKTNFKFEVIVHDDASTDGSAKIIREYEAKYPDIIKPIYQKENQYSKGVSPIADIMIPKAQGKYIAFCECDDFWCNPQKLQLQVDSLEKNNKCSTCCHTTSAVNYKNKQHSYYINKNMNDSIISYEEICERMLLGRDIIHISSLLCKKNILINYYKYKKDYFDFPFLDRPIILYMAIFGGDYYYINKTMSCYRICTPNGWTDRIVSNYLYNYNEIQKIIKSLENLNRFTNGKFTNEISYYRKVQNKKINMIYWREFITTKHKIKYYKKNKQYFKNLTNKVKIHMVLSLKFPKLLNFYIKIKAIVKNIKNTQNLSSIK